MLTPKQKAVLDFMQQFLDEKGYSPSQREIADHFGFTSLGTVQNYLVRLERHGLLRKSWNAKRATEIISQVSTQKKSAKGRPLKGTRDPQPQVPGHSPSLKLVEKNSLIPSTSSNVSSQTPLYALNSAVPLPLLGRVAAGLPIEYTETDQSVDVPRSMFRTPEAEAHAENHFVLKVQGSSMIEDGILDGDYVVIKRQKDAERGQTVVAMVGTEATIKRFYRKGSQIELRPANDRFEPILIDSLTDHRDFRIEGVLVGVIRKLAF